ncbi:unnamed protein product [Dicrocoelium dendriticum]|nr:unnamed protein product [Dicrocoelium dendriticum]
MTECAPEIDREKFLKTFTSVVTKALEPKAFHLHIKPKSFLRDRTRKFVALKDWTWRLYKNNSSIENWAPYIAQRNYSVQLVCEDVITPTRVSETIRFETQVSLQTREWNLKSAVRNPTTHYD